MLGELSPLQPHRTRSGRTRDGCKQASPSLCFCQFDLKEKRSFFGQRKDYWDFMCQALARCRQEHAGVRFVTSLDKVGTGWQGSWGLRGMVFCFFTGIHTLTWALRTHPRVL